MGTVASAPERWSADLDVALRAAGTPERADRERAYLKSAIEHYGASVPAIRKVAGAFARDHPDLGHDEVCALVEVLWETPVFDRRRLAAELLEQFVAALGPDDVPMLERLLRQSRTWALVDEIAPSVVGPLVVAHPELGDTLDRWAGDEDPWIRRAAMLALLLPLRAGGGDFERFARYADAMLDDTDPFIRKAIGWILRDTAKQRPELVYEWLRPRAGRASGVTIREATKHLGEPQRAEVLALRRQAARAAGGTTTR